jgi:hypothetical protein
MALTIDFGRQYAIEASLAFAFGDLAGLSGVAQSAISVPVNAVVQGGRVYTDTAWNSATSDTLSVGDLASATRYISANATVLRTAGLQQEFAATGNGFKYTASSYVTLTWTGVGAVPTTGASRLYVRYTIDGRANEAQQ